jgi:hypothetical protein
MNPNEINRRIAIACGWKAVTQQADDCGTFRSWGVRPNDVESMAPPYPLPNYHGDLNAMHEAEEIIKIIEGEWGGYCGYLVKGNSWFTVVDATAAQRAEAFLRTIGQWEEEEDEDQ